MKKRVIPIFKEPPDCAWCGVQITAHAGSDLPKEGDLTIHFDCGNVLIFNEDLSLRKPETPEEVEEAADALHSVIAAHGKRLLDS